MAAETSHFRLMTGKLQELLLREENLDLTKAVKICRAYEQSNKHVKELRETLGTSTSTQRVNRVYKEDRKFNNFPSKKATPRTSSGNTSSSTNQKPGQQRRDFNILCKKWGISHIKSSPGHQAANGKAESAVKLIKHMMIKTLKDGGDQYEALLELRNTPRQETRSLLPVLTKKMKHKPSFEQTNFPIPKPITQPFIELGYHQHKELTTSAFKVL
ncbi:hypothetical protein LOTGIDRAFT_156806 [Lottia gigantea]|uniref:Integrase catalytic domain-containing protein n=1 Tax=Lottia gigantea TaxID=225164 RepID=V4B5Q3_LOTGI|nr:hypothetical protein LOTGIDRAFT_156806 [Lottia gigantea]ESP02856.1 hypothetical protein LOTGIDRAFT_156806 [Lottia gigantea]